MNGHIKCVRCLHKMHICPLRRFWEKEGKVLVYSEKYFPSLNNFLSCQEPIHTLGEGKKINSSDKRSYLCRWLWCKKWNQTSHLSTQRWKDTFFHFQYFVHAIPSAWSSSLNIHVIFPSLFQVRAVISPY